MQSYDEQRNMINASIFPKIDNTAEAIAKLQEEMSKQNVTNVVIGKLPNKDDEITINGLVFLVKFVDYKRGTIQLRIKKYKEDTEDENGITHKRGEIAGQDFLHQ